ncbi:carbon-nitrogen hydrolase family protein [Methylocystis parvus]|uniref:carbon-nitrogen hydrolase family protein n=1 Tax=Methylocystis parvus TaxID=134 RepID=UPI001930DF94|nr:carbon-nitrogen hydrolase family protein [Methylocystis parvus]WBJ99390.1 carbon-nitrogen hydrolase family protein [Methylocystis parvus OBBP]
MTRIALLHLSPEPGALAQNRRLVDAAIRAAADAGAEWILTPELATTGYEFVERIGSDWIETQPDPWVQGVAEFARRRRVTVFLSVPERVEERRYNTLLAIDRVGQIAGRHRKINALRVGSEAWSTPGQEINAVPIDGFGLVGMLICADAYTPSIAETLARQGARALVSSAAWRPGLHGPNGEWEAVTEATSLPIFVCNRTGQERRIDFTAAQSVVASAGKRLVSFAAPRNAIFLIDWSFEENRLVRHSTIAPFP